MRRTISTPKGKYTYKFVPIYLGIKPIDKQQARENLLLLKQVMDAHGLRFLLFYGTLLGAVREHDFITHDEDIDLVMKIEDRPAFLSTLFELRQLGFEMARYERRGLLSIIRKGEYIDIYFYQDYQPDKALTYCCRDICKREFIDDTTTYDFLGEKFLVPRNYLDYLNYYIGADWRTPIQTNSFDHTAFSTMKEKTKMYIKELLPTRLIEWVQNRSDRPFLEQWVRRIYDPRQPKP